MEDDVEDDPGEDYVEDAPGEDDVEDDPGEDDVEDDPGEDDVETQILKGYIQKYFGERCRKVCYFTQGCGGKLFEVNVDGNLRVVKIVHTPDRKIPEEALIHEELCESSKRIVKLVDHWGSWSHPATFLLIVDVDDEYSHNPSSDGSKSDEILYYFMSMERCDETLSELEQDVINDQNNFKGIVVQCCEGLQHMHDNDITHLDINGFNALVNTRDGTIEVKLADFGTAQRKRGEEDFEHDKNTDIDELRNMFVSSGAGCLAKKVLFKKVMDELLSEGDPAKDKFYQILDQMNIPDANTPAMASAPGTSVEEYPAHE